MNWQLIETAPRDGTGLLLWCAEMNEPVIGRWSVDNATIREWWVDSWAPPDFDSPTHWMALPAGPNVQANRPIAAGWRLG